MIQVILLLVFVGSMLVVFVSLGGRHVRKQVDERYNQLTDEQRGVTWVEGKDGSRHPIDSKEGHIRLDEFLR